MRRSISAPSSRQWPHSRRAVMGRCSPNARPRAKWSPDAKALFIRGGRLVYDIGWLGAMTGGPNVADGHTVVFTLRDGTARLWLDGKRIGEKAGFTRPNPRAMSSRWAAPRRICRRLREGKDQRSACVAARVAGCGGGLALQGRGRRREHAGFHPHREGWHPACHRRC